MPGTGLFVSTGVGTNAAFGLEYDGGDDLDTDFPFDDSDGGLVIDISGFSSFDIDFIMLDLDMTVSVQVLNIDDDGNLTGISIADVVAGAGDDFTLSVGLDDLDGDADLTDVNSIQVLFNPTLAGEPNRDYAVSSITLVPAPASLSMITIAGLALTRRRR